MGELKQILVDELKKYAGQGANAIAFPIFDDERQHYAIAVVEHPKREEPADILIIARIADGKIVIEEDMTDKKLIDALLQRGISRENIILAYEGEVVPTILTV